MSKQFKFSDPGEGLHEAEILEVHVSAGDEVEDGDVVLTVETDKASTEVPAPFTGTVEEVYVSEGETVEVGGVLLTYDDGEDDASGDDQGDEDGEAGEDSAADTSDDGGTVESQAEHQQQGEAEDESDTAEQSTETSSKDDDEQRAETDRRKDGPVPAAPSTRRVAHEKNVELGDIEPSGKQGRVTREDVERAARQAEQGGQQSRPSAQGGGGDAHGLSPGTAQVPTLPDFSQWGEIERMPLRSIRRATAQNMAVSWSQIPHVFHQDIADVTELERFRRRHADTAQANGGKFTLTVLVMKALAAALKQFPRFNASLDIDNQDIVLKRYCHIGLAVATDHGLLVPVIRDVDRKNLVQLTAEATEMARKTRDGEVDREDMMGASMTVTNPGPMGGSSLTPLVNHPQVAILGMAQARLEPVAYGDIDNDEVKSRLRLPLILGFDHRVNDGADAAQFVTHMIKTLADPESLLLDV